MAALSYDGKYIYMCNGGAGSATQITNFIDEKIFVLNPDGTLVNTIELDRRKMSNLYYGDDKYLFIGSLISCRILIRAILAAVWR